MKVVNLLNRVLKSQGQQLTKENEYMWWSPFVSHHKPKLQVNIKSENGIVGYRGKVDIIFFSYLEKLMLQKNITQN